MEASVGRASQELAEVRLEKATHRMKQIDAEIEELRAERQHNFAVMEDAGKELGEKIDRGHAVGREPQRLERAEPVEPPRVRQSVPPTGENA